jgi:hypothetical protein
VAILVDDPIWDWRGRKWAHLVSDSHLDELHDFAHRLGMPYLAFQGDHYDIHTELRHRALVAGARAVAGRELVVALRDAGLRRRGGVEPWRWGRRGRPDHLVGMLPRSIVDAVRETVTELASSVSRLELGLAHRSTEALVVLSSDEIAPISPGLEAVAPAVSVHRSAGERGTFVEWRLTR